VLSYYDRYGNLVPRLCDFGSRASDVFGEKDDVRLRTE
jgi:hypothetical protein